MVEFIVPAMSCGHCVGVITQKLKQFDPQARVEIDLGGKKVKVESSRDRDALAGALTAAGYPPAAA